MPHSRSLLRASILLVLGATLAAAPPSFAGEVCKAPSVASLLAPPPATVSAAIHPDSACTAWVETSYFSNASETTQVGRCTITCHQFDTGDAEPTFSYGGTCTGSSSAYYSQYFTACPCPP
jgi:hypothetical protein